MAKLTRSRRKRPQGNRQNFTYFAVAGAADVDRCARACRTAGNGALAGVGFDGSLNDRVIRIPQLNEYRFVSRCFLLQGHSSAVHFRRWHLLRVCLWQYRSTSNCVGGIDTVRAATGLVAAGGRRRRRSSASRRHRAEAFASLEDYGGLLAKRIRRHAPVLSDGRFRG